MTGAEATKQELVVWLRQRFFRPRFTTIVAPLEDFAVTVSMLDENDPPSVGALEKNGTAIHF